MTITSLVSSTSGQSMSIADIEAHFYTGDGFTNSSMDLYTADDTDPYIGTIAKSTSNMGLDDYYGSSKFTGRIVTDLDSAGTSGNKRYGWGTKYSNFIEPENPYDPQHEFGYCTRTDFNLGFNLEGIYSEWHWPSYPQGQCFVVAATGAITEPTTWTQLHMRFIRPTGTHDVTFNRSWASWLKTNGLHGNHTPNDHRYWIWIEEHAGAERVACQTALIHFIDSYNSGKNDSDTDSMENAYNYVTFRWS